MGMIVRYKSERALIASQLSLGVEHSHIQRNLYTSYPNELQRKITKVDLKNIAKAYGINKIQNHSADSLSVDAHVEENIEQPRDIFLYKRLDENNLHDIQESNQIDNDMNNFEVHSNSNNNETNSDCQNFDKNSVFQLLTSKVNTNMSELKSNLLCKTMALCDLIKNCDEKDLLLSAKAHINSAASVLKSKPSEEVTLNSTTQLQSGGKIKSIPTKKKVERQLRFHLTKQKRKSQKVKLSKPTDDEKEELEVEILYDGNEIEYNDHSYS